MDKSNVTQLHPTDKKDSKEEFLGSSLSPREIVSELDRFVVGQNKAKKAIKVAADICVFTNDNVKIEKI